MQHDYSIDNDSGAAVRADINDAFEAAVTRNSGTSGPSTTYANMTWPDTTNHVEKVRNEANTAWIIRGRTDAEGVLAKAANYTLALRDFGKLIDATSATWTLTLMAAATATDGFWFEIRNSGTGIVTIDADAAETIDGQTTVEVHPGEFVRLQCNGTLWRSSLVHRLGAIPESVQTGDYTVTAIDRGKLVLANKATAITINLTAAATLGKGFVVGVKNIGLGPAAIDANSAETIDGETTKLLATGQSCLLECDGASWRTVTEFGPYAIAPTVAQTGSASITTAQARGHVHIYTGAGGHTLTLPAANWAEGSVVHILDRGAGVLSVARAGSDTIEVGSASPTTIKLKPGDSVSLRSDGASKWDLIGGKTRDYETITGHIETPANKTYYIMHKVLKPGTIVGIKGKGASGTTTLTVRINGVAATFSGTLSFTSAGQSFTATSGNTLAVGDEITFVLSASGTEFRFSLDIDWDR